MHEVTFRWNRAEHIRAHRAIMKYRARPSWQRALPSAAATLLGLVLVLGLVGSPSPTAYLLAIIPWLIVIALWLVLLLWGVPWLAARRVAKEDPSAQGDIKHVVGESGFSVSTPVATVHLTWDHILQVRETAEFILYYYAKGWAYFTPKRAFTPSALEALRQDLRRWGGGRSILLDAAAIAA